MGRRLMATGAAVLAGMALAAPATAVEPPIDTVPYLVNVHGRMLTGTHALSQVSRPGAIYYVLWSPSAYQLLTYDGDWIYLAEDHSVPDGSSYRFSDARWMRRFARVGDRVQAPNNVIQSFALGASSCTPTTAGLFPYSTTLERRSTQYDLRGDLGRQDVIVLRYDYRSASGSDFERIYYAKGWGMVKWELLRGGQVVYSSLFNRVSTSAPTPPDTSNSCVGSPITVPAMPASLPQFVDMLYSCVLEIDQPDEPGFKFWLGDLRRGALSVQGAYTEFFRYQPGVLPNLSHAEFVRKLYACMLFRSVDDATLQRIAAELARGALTRAGLVQTVLTSTEFRTAILPRLQLLR